MLEEEADLQAAEQQRNIRRCRSTKSFAQPVRRKSILQSGKANMHEMFVTHLDTSTHMQSVIRYANAHHTTANASEDVTTEFFILRAIGMLMYRATITRPDLSFSFGQLSRFVARPSSKRIGTGKRVLRYLVGTQIMESRTRE